MIDGNIFGHLFVHRQL